MTSTTKKKPRKLSGASSSATTETAPKHAPAPAGILDGNGRVARLARWLREMPKPRDVDQLVLEMKSEDGWTRVQSWTRADVGMHLALPIDSLVTDLANEIGAYTSCKVSWISTESGEVWTEHALRAQPDGLQVTQAFGGTAQDTAIQTQRALERLVGAFMGGIETSSRLAERSAEIASANFEAAQAELGLLRERVIELERENADLEMQLEETVNSLEKTQTDQAQNAGKQQFTQMVTQLIASQAMAGGTKPPAS